MPLTARELAAMGQKAGGGLGKGLGQLLVVRAARQNQKDRALTELGQLKTTLTEASKGESGAFPTDFATTALGRLGSFGPDSDPRSLQASLENYRAAGEGLVAEESRWRSRVHTEKAEAERHARGLREAELARVAGVQEDFGGEITGAAGARVDERNRQRDQRLSLLYREVSDLRGDDPAGQVSEKFRDAGADTGRYRRLASNQIDAAITGPSADYRSGAALSTEAATANQAGETSPLFMLTTGYSGRQAEAQKTWAGGNRSLTSPAITDMEGLFKGVTTKGEFRDKLEHRRASVERAYDTKIENADARLKVSRKDKTEEGKENTTFWDNRVNRLKEQKALYARGSSEWDNVVDKIYGEHAPTFGNLDRATTREGFWGNIHGAAMEVRVAEAQLAAKPGDEDRKAALAAARDEYTAFTGTGLGADVGSEELARIRRVHARANPANFAHETEPTPQDYEAARGVVGRRAKERLDPDLGVLSRMLAPRETLPSPEDEISLPHGEEVIDGRSRRDPRETPSPERPEMPSPPEREPARVEETRAADLFDPGQEALRALFPPGQEFYRALEATDKLAPPASLDLGERLSQIEESTAWQQMAEDIPWRDDLSLEGNLDLWGNQAKWDPLDRADLADQTGAPEWATKDDMRASLLRLLRIRWMKEHGRLSGVSY